MINFNQFPSFDTYRSTVTNKGYSGSLNNPVLLSGDLPCDRFEKTSQKPAETSSVASVPSFSISNVWTKERLDKIYGEVWDSVIKNTPIVSELNIEKPKFIFDKEPKSKGAQAAYCFINNTIECNANNLEDYYLHVIKDKDGNIETLFDVLNKSASDEIFPESKKANPDLELMRLTDKEKEIYLRGAFAHEIRHCIQEHLMASTEGCADIHKAHYKESADSINKSLGGVDLSELDEDTKNEFDFSYSQNYKPKKLLDANTKIKYSMAKSDDRYISVKDHFLKDMTDDMQHKAYKSSPVEMDANNFAYEYLLRYQMSSPDGVIANVRDNVFLGIVNQYDLDAQYALDTMGQYGFMSLK